MTEDAELGATPDDRQILVYQELGGSDGGLPRSLALGDFDFKPLSYDDLVSVVPNQGLTIDLELSNARVVQTNVEGLDSTGTVGARFTLESHFTAKAIGLVRGGWLPSALAATRANSIVLPDRNIISEVVGRFDGGQLKRDKEDFLDLFSDREIQINPLLGALEGNSRSIPRPEAVSAQIEEAVSKISTALPKARILVGERSLEGVLGLIEDSRAGLQRKQSLLQKLAPSLAAPVAQKNVNQRWSEVIEAVDESGVSRRSILVLALLSILTNPSGICAAKRLIKPRAEYGPEDAYNALCDLRSLDILISLFALYPNERIQLCTADRNLALFWAGLGATGFIRDGGAVRFDLQPHEAILSGPYADRWLGDVASS